MLLAENVPLILMVMTFVIFLLLPLLIFLCFVGIQDILKKLQSQKARTRSLLEHTQKLIENQKSFQEDLTDILVRMELTQDQLKFMDNKITDIEEGVEKNSKRLEKIQKEKRGKSLISPEPDSPIHAPVWKIEKPDVSLSNSKLSPQEDDFDDLWVDDKLYLELEPEVTRQEQDDDDKKNTLSSARNEKTVFQNIEYEFFASS